MTIQPIIIANMPKIVTEIFVNAPVSVCLNVLQSFGKYPEWNPFLLSASGEFVVGKPIFLIVKLPRKDPNRLPVILIQNDSTKLHLRSSLAGGFVTGDHFFEVVDVGSGVTKFRQYEIFSGFLARPLGWTTVMSDIQLAFEQMNAALKERSENIQRETLLSAS